MLITAETVRRVGIRAGILPRNFPKLEKIIFRYIDDAAINYGGYGGFMWTGEPAKFKPFLIVNLHYNCSVSYLMSTIAHEFLHIAQYRHDCDINHGNKFRKACAKYAKALGVDYYLLFGYDAPSVAVAKAKGKSMENWFLSFRGREDIKAKTYQSAKRGVK